MKKPEDDFPNNSIEDKINKLREIENKNIPHKRPKAKNEDLTKVELLNKKISNILSSENSEEKKKTGIIIVSLIIFVLLFSSYYFLIYGPYQEELSSVKTSKLNELNSYYKGPLATANEAYTLKNKIDDSESIHEVKSIDILRTATKSWKSYQLKDMKVNTDQFNRTMVVFSANESKTIIMNIENATQFVNENDADVLSNIEFEKPNTVAVPVLISRLQAGGGLLTLGSIVDVYSLESSINDTNQSTINNSKSPDISGSTVLAILRCEESGEIEADYSKSHIITKGNETNPNEDAESFSTSVEEMLKGAIAGGYDESQTVNLLNSYGLKLSDYEREANLGDLESEYIILIEVPQDKAQFVLENMENIIITLPTEHAPDWMVSELSKTYL